MGKKRKSIRLKGYDYSQPASYFVTICAYQFQHYWGKVEDGTVILNEWGEKVKEEWFKTEEIRSNVTMGEFILMPNHLHGIITLHPLDGIMQDFYYPDFCSIPDESKLLAYGKYIPNALPTIIKQIKSCATQQVRKLGFPIDTKHWHKGYYERVIRNPNELERIENYICNNPYNWQLDVDYFKKLLEKMEEILD